MLDGQAVDSLQDQQLELYNAGVRNCSHVYSSSAQW